MLCVVRVSFVHSKDCVRDVDDRTFPRDDRLVCEPVIVFASTKDKVRHEGIKEGRPF